MRIADVKFGERVRLKPCVVETKEWQEFVAEWDHPASLRLAMLSAANGEPMTALKCYDSGPDTVLVEVGNGIGSYWLRSDWLEPVEAEAESVESGPSASYPPDAIGLRLGGFVAVNRVTSIDLTSDQLVELVATSFGSRPKAGTMSIGTTREEGVLRTFNLRWQEQAPGGDS